MIIPPRLRLGPRSRVELIEVAAGRQPSDLLLHGCEVLNVYTGRLETADVGLAGGRIAWVGPRGDRRGREEIDLGGRVVVPGLVEPHGHPDIVYTPSSIVASLLAWGTTTFCADIVFLVLGLDDEDLHRVLAGMNGASVKFFWQIRCCLDGLLPIEEDRLGADRLARLLAEVPGVTSTGEMTAWRRLLAGDRRFRGFVDRAIEAGLRIDGHAAGASAGTVGQLAAAGITSDHESITCAEVTERLRAGMWVMVRDSSLRPDAPILAEGIVGSGLPTQRMMLTTDGPIAADLLRGHLDRVVRRVIRAGVDPVEAVRMASLNPATYLGLDAHIGGVAPGRCADLLVVDDLVSFNPSMTVADGRVVAADGVRAGFTEWSQLAVEPLRGGAFDTRLLGEACASAPAMTLEGVITRRCDPPAPDLPAGWSRVALVARDGSWMVGTTVRGLSTDALASSYSGSGDVVLIGRDLEAMTRAYRRVVEMGGAIVTPRDELPLAALGRCFDGPLDQLARSEQRIAGAMETAPAVPLSYLFLFLSLAVLPDLRLTPLGIIDVKKAVIIHPPVKLHQVA